jgi:hypothetical protein
MKPEISKQIFENPLISILKEYSFAIEVVECGRTDLEMDGYNAAKRRTLQFWS